MSVTKRDLPEIHVRRESNYGIDTNVDCINYNHVPEEYLLSLSDDSGKLIVPWYHFERLSERLRKPPYHGGLYQFRKNSPGTVGIVSELFFDFSSDLQLNGSASYQFQIVTKLELVNSSKLVSY